MATLKPELRKILDKYGIDPRDKSQIWDCHGTLVLYHRAYEVIAAKEGIVFNPPLVLEANGIGKSVALCVQGLMGERSEWSVGEAAPGNNKNSYPYAMAEKRAKDRVVGKLVGLSEYVYSESEADEFTKTKGDADNEAVEHKPAEKPDPLHDDDYWEKFGNEVLADAKSAATVAAVNLVLSDRKRGIATMKANAPLIYNTMKTEIERYRNTLPAEAS